MSTVSASGIRGKLRALKAVAQIPKFHPLGLMNRNRGVFGLNLGHNVERRRKGGELDPGNRPRNP